MGLTYPSGRAIAYGLDAADQGTWGQTKRSLPSSPADRNTPLI